MVLYAYLFEFLHLIEVAVGAYSYWNEMNRREKVENNSPILIGKGLELSLKLNQIDEFGCELPK